MLLIYDFNITTKHLAIGIARFFLYFAIIDSLLAVLIYYNIIYLSIGSFLLAPNPIYVPRLHGVSGDPTSLGGVAGLGLLSSIYFIIINSDRWANIKYYAVSLFLGLIIVMSGSRTAIVSLMISVSLMLGYSYGFKKVIIVIMVMIIPLIAFIMSFLEILEIPYNTISVYFMKVFRPDDVAMKGTRLDIWIHTINLFFDGSVCEILLGHGFYSLKNAFRSAHNTYLEFLFDYGMLFVISLMLYIVLLFRKAIRFLKVSSSQISALYAIGLLNFALVFAFFLTSLFSKNFYMTNFAFICAVVLIAKL
jgi:O-antigen ligase